MKEQSPILGHDVMTLTLCDNGYMLEMDDYRAVYPTEKMILPEAMCRDMLSIVEHTLDDETITADKFNISVIIKAEQDEK